MYKILLPLLFLFVSCKGLNDFDPYVNQDIDGPQVLSMKVIGLEEGSDFGGCFLAADLIKLHESATNRSISLENMGYEIFIDGLFYSGGSINNFNNSDLNCSVDVMARFDGQHEVAISLEENNGTWDYEDSGLASFFGYNQNAIYFREELDFTEQHLGDVEIISENLQDGMLTLNFKTIGGQPPSVFRFSNKFGSGKDWEEYFFGKTNTVTIEWDMERTKIFEMEYSNRHENKSTTVYLP